MNELHKTRRELHATRRALERYGQPLTSQLTVAALATVLQHNVPRALEEAQRDRARLAEQLRIARAQVRTAKNRYSDIRYETWRLAQAGIMGAETHLDALESVVRAAEDSDDDRDWEARNA